MPKLCSVDLSSPEPAPQLCPPHRACHNGKPAVRIIDALFCSLGFSLLTTPHLGLFLLWILIFLNMSMTNVCTSLYSVPLMSSIYLIYIETSAGILIGKDLVSCLNNCKCSTGNKNNVLVSFLCELASNFFVKIDLCYLLCKISCWVKIFFGVSPHCNQPQILENILRKSL